MSSLNDRITAMSQGARVAAGAALLAIGVAVGGGAASLTRPGIEMAPTVVTPIAKLGATTGIVTVKGRVAEIYGNRALLIDGSGKTMIDIGRGGASSLAVGNTVLVQGRYDDGQVRASFLVEPDGKVDAIRPEPRGGHRPGPDGGPGRPDPRVGSAAPETGIGCAPPVAPAARS